MKTTLHTLMWRHVSYHWRIEKYLHYAFVYYIFKEIVIRFSKSSLGGCRKFVHNIVSLFVAIDCRLEIIAKIVGA